MTDDLDTTEGEQAPPVRDEFVGEGGTGEPDLPDDAPLPEPEPEPTEEVEEPA